MHAVHFPQRTAASTTGTSDNAVTEQAAVPQRVAPSGNDALTARTPPVAEEGQLDATRIRVPLPRPAPAGGPGSGGLAARKAQALKDLLARERGASRTRLSPALAVRLQDIAVQLARGGPDLRGPDHASAPQDDAWTCVQALDGLKDDLSEAQLLEARTLLQGSIRASARSSADMRLMSKVFDAATTAGAPALVPFLAQTVVDGLGLNEIRTPGDLREHWETEPNSRAFNSVLPSVAGVVYEHDSLGRTLLWQGASGLFPGASEARRRATLEALIFDFPRDPGEGGARLEDTYDFILAVDEMGLDEVYDVAALKALYALHDGTARNP